MDYLARTLPIATAGNPKYRSGADGPWMAWITKAVNFETAKDSVGLMVSMSEDALEFRNGARTAAGSHETQFSLADVTISERRDEGTLTESGDAALAVMIQCNSGKCIRASYDGKPTMVDWTDISIQDAALREKILAAFKALKEPKSP